MACPVCSGDRSVPLVRRDRVPVFQNLLFATASEARACARGELDIRRCPACGFVWNAGFDASIIDYTGDYENCQTHSAAFRRHHDERIAAILAALPTEGDLVVVEIGCGQGDFLSALIEAARSSLAPGSTIRGIGFDPALREERAGNEGNLTLVREYLTRDNFRALGVRPDAILSRHTIEHVPDPIAFLGAIRDAVRDFSGIPLFLETPDSNWILENAVYHDFFYEHCSLFNFRSMALALETAGFSVVSLEGCFDRQYLWAQALTGAAASTSAPGGFPDREAAYRDTWTGVLRAAALKGGTAVWGAGAKGATFALAVDPGCELVDCVVDINPRKQGRFLPLTAHPVVAPGELAARNIGTVLVMNGNYEAEIRETLAGLGLSVDVKVVR